MVTYLDKTVSDVFIHPLVWGFFQVFLYIVYDINTQKKQLTPAEC